MSKVEKGARHAAKAAKKDVSLKRMIKAIWGIRLPWLFLILYVVVSAAMVVGNLLMASATGDMVDSSGTIQTATLVSFVLAYVVIGAGGTATTIFGGLAGERINASLRERLWHKLMYVPQSHYDVDGGETLVSRVTTDCDYTSSLLITLVNILTLAFSLVGYVMSMMTTSSQLALPILALAPLSAVVGVFYSKARYWLGTRTQGTLSDSTYYLVERTKNLPLIKLSGTSQLEAERGGEAFDAQYRMDVWSGYLDVIYQFINTLLDVAGIFITFGLGAALASQGVMSAGDVIAFYTISSSVTLAFSNLISDCGTVRNAVGSMERVAQCMESEVEDIDAGTDMDVPNEDIRLDGVTFGYANAEPVLRDLTCVIPKGKVTAVVGANGCGKSTLFKLLERFYRPQQGAIYFGQTPVEDFSLSAWRRAFGLVSQDRPVMEGTLRENIVYGCERDVTDEELWQVARMANLEDLVRSLPEGFDTRVAPGGRNFSGGQCQCIAIARTIMHNPDYLLLDEATSSLDVKSETAVVDAIHNLMAGRTTVVIAHSVSAIRNADNVLVIQDGKVEASGTPAQVMGESDFFQNFVESQAGAAQGLLAE
jgi:ATP-binding cassette subfamily B protein AbcA/BmrA